MRLIEENVCVSFRAGYLSNILEYIWFVCERSLWVYNLPIYTPLNSICYPHVFRLSTEARIHSCKHEDMAIEAYTTYMKQKHVNFQVNRCGTFIVPESPFLHATQTFCVNVTVVASVVVKLSALTVLKDLTLKHIVEKNHVPNQMVRSLYWRENMPTLFMLHRQVVQRLSRKAFNPILNTGQLSWQSYQFFWRNCVLP